MKGKNLHPPLHLCKFGITDSAMWTQISKSFFSFISRPTLKAQLKSSADMVRFSWRKSALGDVYWEEKLWKAEELNPNNAATLRHAYIALTSSVLAWLIIWGRGQGGGREENNTVTFLKSAPLWLWELKTMEIRASPFSKSSMDHILWTWKPQRRLPKAWNHLTDGHPRPRSSCE